MDKMILSLSFLFCFCVSLKAQSIDDIISEKMLNFPIYIDDLQFGLRNVDTVEGIEIMYYSKHKKRCDVHLFFVDNAELDSCMIQGSLSKYLTASEYNYHYISYGNYSSFFGCMYTNIDTLDFCNNSIKCSENFNALNASPISYYSYKGNYFYVAKVRLIAYKLISENAKYADLFYHFAKYNNQVKFIEKIIYKKVLNRKYITLPSMFEGTLSNDDFDCKTIYD